MTASRLEAARHGACGACGGRRLGVPPKGLWAVEGWGCRGAKVLVIGMATYGTLAAEGGT